MQRGNDFELRRLMKVATTRPFQIIYSVFHHEHLGYLFEAYVVQLDDMGRLTLQHQSISSQNANEFAKRLDSVDFQLIALMDDMHQNSVVRKFYNKMVKPAEFFSKVYNGYKANEPLISQINQYLDRKRAEIMELVRGKMLFEMGSDGEPAWRRLEIMPEKATVLFHFRRNEGDTHYFPTIKYAGEKLNFQYNGSYVICNEPAWLVVEGKAYSFKKDVDGNKLLPFLNKKFIKIPESVEDAYYRRFIAPLVALYDVYAVGFDIVTQSHVPVPTLLFSTMVQKAAVSLNLFGEAGHAKEEETDLQKFIFELHFEYGRFSFRPENNASVSVFVEKKNGSYTFYRINRDLQAEKKAINRLKEMGLDFKNGRLILDKPEAFAWLNDRLPDLEAVGFVIKQAPKDQKRYFVGKSSLKLEIIENIDWFDIKAEVMFGDYAISFLELRKIMLKKGSEITLPNGQTAVIPESWINRYSELFAFAHEQDNKEGLKLRKHHLTLIQDLDDDHKHHVAISKKLKKLRDFEQIEEAPMPREFVGKLRPYQKAGYNWLLFLNKFNFGGCLADDMGLGKTVQTLAMLQYEKEKGASAASLLIMPTSLVYNWEKEAAKFTPGLKILNYRGANRSKDPAQFDDYDLVLTSYGVARLDVDILKEYDFNYIILDESQAIKNPRSIIARAVRRLKSKNRLILTGTPLENSVLDLWSQMNFLNPGLLGSYSYFTNEFLQPIERKKDEAKTQKLSALIKPFILRRDKSQVATELPEKVVTIQYCSMTPAQEERYEEAKNYYRERILNEIESNSNDYRFTALQGLTQLRQIANHPKLTDESYHGDSGKLEDVISMISNGVNEGHKILIFSQFVKHLRIVKDFLNASDIRYCYLDGSTRDMDRMAEVETFQNNEDVKIFLISLKAGGLGLNLTQADYVFLLDPWWNPAIEAQAIDRAHRIGQENKVFTYKFITKDTVEEKILILQEKKISLSENLISTEDSFVKDLTKEDIEGLFA